MSVFPLTNSPLTVSGLACWYDTANLASITKAYVTIVATGTGSSGASSFTCSTDATSIIPVGAIIKLGGDSYTVTNVVTTTISVTPNLITNYSTAAIQLDQVSQLYDLSGNKRHATQGTSGNQPIYVPNAQNGSVVDFIRAADAMAIPSLDLQTAFTSIVVLKLDVSIAAGASIRDVFGKSNNNANLFIRQSNAHMEQKCVLTGGADPRSNLDYSVYDNSAYGITISEVNLSNRTIYLQNGTSNTQTNTTAASFQTPTDTWLIGRTNTGDAKYKVAEFMFFNKSLSTAERTQMIRYIENKRGLL